MGGAPHEAFVAEVAALSRPAKSLVLGGERGNVVSPSVAMQIRRLSSPRGSAARRDVFVAADIYVSSEEGVDLERGRRTARRKRMATQGKAATKLHRVSVDAAESVIVGSNVTASTTWRRNFY